LSGREDRTDGAALALVAKDSIGFLQFLSRVGFTQKVMVLVTTSKKGEQHDYIGVVCPMKYTLDSVVLLTLESPMACVNLARLSATTSPDTRLLSFCFS
jgi:hypothetical protein